MSVAVALRFLRAAVLLAAAAGSVEDPFDVALDLYRAGELVLAHDRLQASIASHPEDPRLHYLLALVYRDSTPVQMDKAVQELEQARRFGLDTTEVASLTAELLDRSGHRPQAEALLRERLASRPAEARSQGQLGSMLLADGDVEEGRRLLEEAVLADPSDAFLWKEAGRARLRAGEADAAVDALQRAALLDPSAATVRYTLALAYQAAHRDAEAEATMATFRQMLAARNESQEQLRRREYLHRTVALLESTLEDDPSAPPEDYEELAWQYRPADLVVRGREFFEALQQARPDRPGPWVGAAALAADIDEEEEAWGDLLLALERDPTGAVAVPRLLPLATSTERQDTLRLRLQARLAAAESPDHLLTWLGSLELQAGNVAAAASALERAREGLPTDPDVLLQLGVLRARSGRKVEALSLFRQLVKAHPQVGQGWFNLGAVEVELGLAERAVPHLEKAVALLGEVPAALNLLGRVHAQSGDTAGAAEMFRRSLAAAPDQPDIRAELEKLPSGDGGR